MFFISLLLVAAAEVAAFVLVGEQVGFGWALLILILVSALGPFVVRRVGSGVLARTRERLALGEVPTRELLDGVVILVGGARHYSSGSLSSSSLASLCTSVVLL